MQEIKVIKNILDSLNLYPWTILATIFLGFFASLAEGLSISLFIPFLQNLDGSS